MKRFTFFLLLLIPFFSFSQDTLVKWTFPNNPDDSIADRGTAANLVMTISANGGTSAMNFTSAGVTTFCAGANKWDAGNATKFWQIKVVTSGYQTLHISSKQRSSATGPKDFKLQYKNGYGGTWTDITGGTIINANNWTSGVLTNLVLPAACNNQDTVYIRWIMTSNNSVGLGTVASTGTSRIDDIWITGTQIVPDVTPPNVVSAFATGFSTVKVKFSEAVNITAENTANYTGLGTIASAIRCTTNDTVTLSLLTPLSPGVPDTVIIANVQDIANNTMLVAESFQVIFGTPPDITPPTVLHAYATSLSTVKVKFSEAVNTTAENVANYTGIGTITLAVRCATNDTVTLTLSTPLSPGVPDTVIIANVQDIANNTMTIAQSFPVVYGNLPDITPPTVLNAYAASLTKVKVKFSEKVNTTAENIANYTGLGTIATALRSTSLDTVTLTLSTPLTFGVPETLTVSNIQDTSGNAMVASQQFQIEWGNLNNQNIVITEIMYNPPEAGTDTLEFIELYNNGTTPIGLKNFYFSMGVVYTFHNDTIQPSDFYLVAVDSLAFSHFYHKTAHQWTSGNLLNTGEAIVLKDNFGTLVDSVYYHTSNPWPANANGNGSSLMLCNPSANNNVGTSWSASGAANSLAFGVVNNKEVYGSPASGCLTINVDSVPPYVTSAFATNLSTVKVFFNEAVELASSQNIANYTGLVSISSAVRSPITTVTLTLGTPLVPGIADTLTILGVKDTSGNTMIIPQSYVLIYNTLIEDVQISEIMYNDPSTVDSLEFIELHNRATSVANISNYNFAHGPTYTFPINTFISPGGYLVLALNATAVNNFFGITGTLQWAAGNLLNAAEKLEIRNSSGSVIDSLTYRTNSPWPTTPNGLGPSLAFCNPALDNSVGANWSASTVLAGVLNGVNVYATPGTDCAGTIYPTVINAFAVNQTNVKVVFSVAMNNTADNVTNYTGLGSIASAIRCATNDTVTLTLTTPLVIGTMYTLTIANVQSLAGIAMASPQNFNIIFNNTVEDMMITEIMYNDPSLNADSLEYIELYNNGADVANIGGYSFSQGVVFQFPSNTIVSPSNYIVVAKNAQAVDNFFGITGTLQWASGSLSNSGETIKIVNTKNTTIDSVTYGISNPWPASPNGNGPSLTFCDTSLDNSVGANWTASTELAGVLNATNVYGSPGTGCTIVITYPTVLNAYAVSLLSVKVVFSEAVNTTAENVANYTGLGTIVSAVRSLSNDTVTLTLTTPLTPGVTSTLTIANVQNIAGNAMTAPQSFDIIFNNTVKDIVITEIMYNDPSLNTDSLEFIELYNNGATAANIGGYVISQGVVYQFPGSTMMNPSTYLVIAKNALAVNNFFGITGTLQWTSGVLSNTGELIKIVNSENATIDSVNYGVSSPWPSSPNGNGPSLTFCDPVSTDNALGANWEASAELAGILNGINVYATPGTGCITTGISEETALPGIFICPNPAHGETFIYHSGEAFEFKIFDILGNLIIFAATDGNSVTKLNLENLQTGMYLLQITNPRTNESIIKKLITY